MLAFVLAVLLAQPPASACAVSDEPDFGTTKERPVEVGGGAMTVVARERRYLDALRGPNGETLQYRRIGSFPVERDRLVFLDRYEVTYAGLEKPIYLFLDAYHFDDGLKAPKGFVCAVPIGLTAPAPDPILASESTLALAVEQGSTKDFAPISLDADGSATHGVIFDRFRMMARAARSAAAAGQPIDVTKPNPALVGTGTVIVAYPLRCGDNESVSAAHVEIVTTQGQPPARTGDLSTGEGLAKLLPAMNFPPGSVAASFPLDRPRPTDSIKIGYPERLCGAASEVVLPMTFTAAKAVRTPMPALPAGQSATDRPVRLQALIDLDGRAQRITYIGGPSALAAAAMDAVRGWTAEPARLNGTPIIAPVTFQVKFGPQ